MTTAPEADFIRHWSPSPGLVFLGPVEGSGLKDRSYLLQRGDGQIVQLSELLQLVMATVSPEKSADELARDVSDAYGLELSVSGLLHLIDTRLAPMGLVHDADADLADAVTPPRANPLLALRLRGTLLPEKAVNTLALILAPLYWRPVVAAVLAGLAAVDILVLAKGDFLASLKQVLLTPALLLGIFAMLTVGAVIHELGHATACRYGGARPGVIGVGVYLVFPAFFTNVTDSYRLGRAGRIRTDLGGLYFNCLCLIGLGGAYLLTGQGFFLLAAALMHFEMIQQLVPTLRFDGYFVLADIAGVPDLFNRIRPVLLSLVPGRAVDPRVAELRTFARRIVTIWVVTVVPLLCLALGWMLLNLPLIIEQTADAIRQHAGLASEAIAAGDPVAAALSILSILMLSLPVIGLAILLYRLLSVLLDLLGRLGRRLWRLTAEPESVVPRHLRAARPQTVKPLQMGSHYRKEGPPWLSQSLPQPCPTRSPRAIACSRPFSSPRGPPGRSHARRRRSHPPGLPRRQATRPAPLAETGWQGAVRRFSRNSLSLGPGRRELAHLDAVEEVQRRLDGPRTVVVVNPKGGAHKTTATLLLAATLGIQRGGYTLAWDNNETRGTMGWRAPLAGHAGTAVDLMREVDRFEDPVLGRVGDLDRYVRYQGSAQFDVLASDEDAAGAATIGSREFDRLHTALRRFYRIIMVDTGNNMRSSNWEAAVAAADELVIVSTVREDTVASAVWLVDGLRERGYQDKVSNAVTLLAAPSLHTDLQLHDRTRTHFETLTREVLDVPYDKSLVSGGRSTTRR
ncbi:ESX-1 secretion-associated protein EspI [Arthrobacter sp. Hiyo4]|nr:ESX-1 secretion-associated protein EspI [Arthrobacter sp. Hiyo4]